MNSAAAFLPKFYLVASTILILSGVAQVFVRPRRPRETIVEKLINRSTITALFSVVFGVLGFLLGLGILKMPRF
jgi:hypothetical protein